MGAPSAVMTTPTTVPTEPARLVMDELSSEFAVLRVERPSSDGGLPLLEFQVGLHNYGVCSYGLEFQFGLYSYGLYNYGLYSYGLEFQVGLYAYGL